MAATDQPHIFLWAQKQSEIINILQSHSPRYGDVHVISSFTEIKNGHNGLTS